MSDTKHIHVEVDKDAAPNALVYRFTGIFGETTDSYRFLDHMREEMGSEEFAARERIVFNLGGIDFLSSVGVGVLASCYTTAKEAEKTFVMTGVSDQACRVLQVTGLCALVPRYATEADALSSDAEPLPNP